jgi:hypothetical protein
MQAGGELKLATQDLSKNNAPYSFDKQGFFD